MSDTIAAIATAPGQGGIAIVRVSGDMAEDILRRIFRPVGGKHPLPTRPRNRRTTAMPLPNAMPTSLTKTARTVTR